MAQKTKNSEEILEPDSFTGMNLNETGLAEDFIEKLKAQTAGFGFEYKNEFVLSVIRRINHEKDWHNSLCALDDCSVKQYFEKCLDMLKRL
jgi:hypothetical protein